VTGDVLLYSGNDAIMGCLVFRYRCKGQRRSWDDIASNATCAPLRAFQKAGQDAVDTEGTNVVAVSPSELFIYD
jgi:hypothetical protein